VQVVHEVQIEETRQVRESVRERMLAVVPGAVD
jgi:hypothetical protein